MEFKKAVKKEAKARIALIGVSGSGKTYSALVLARTLGGKVAVIDTEAGSASKYADEFDFDVLELTSFHPDNYIQAILSAQKAGYQTIIIDSLSHAWTGKDGELELKDRASAQSKSGNTYFAWRDITPLHNKLIDTMLQAKLHVIVTMRAKTEYIVETINGKQTPKKVGMAPVMRDGMEYEFDIVADLEATHTAIITKTRCRALDGKAFSPITNEMGDIVLEWVAGEKVPEPPKVKDVTPEEAQRIKDAINQALNYCDEKTKKGVKEVMDTGKFSEKTLEFVRSKMRLNADDLVMAREVLSRQSDGRLEKFNASVKAGDWYDAIKIQEEALTVEMQKQERADEQRDN